MLPIMKAGIVLLTASLNTSTRISHLYGYIS
jgi:hypothetical protein